MREFKWDEIDPKIIGNCVQKIISDNLKLSKKMLESALETFYNIKVIEED